MNNELTYEEREFLDTVKELIKCEYCEKDVEIDVYEYSEEEDFYDLLKWEIPGILSDLLEKNGIHVSEYYFRSVEQPYPDYLFLMEYGGTEYTLGIYIDVDYEDRIIRIIKMQIKKGKPSKSFLVYYT